MLVLLGDSHTHAINFGYERLSRREKFLFWLKFGRLRGGTLGAATHYRQDFFTVFPDRIYFTGQPMKRLKELLSKPFFEADDSRYFVFSLGFHHPIYKSKTWKHYTLDPSDKKKQFVSHAMFREMVLYGNAPILDFYSSLRELGVGFIVIASPPPSYTSYRATANAAVSGEEFIAIFERTRSVFAEELDRMGVHSFFPPKTVATSKGFLKENLRTGGGTRDHHASAQYGKLFLSHILSNARGADFHGPGWSVWLAIQRKIARVLLRVTSLFEKRPADSLLDMVREKGNPDRAAK